MHTLKKQCGKLSLEKRTSQLAFPLLVTTALVAQWRIGDAGRDLVSIPVACALVWASLVDREREILPNVLTIGLVLAGLAWAMRPGGDIITALIGAGAGYLVFTLTGWLFLRLRGREGLGQGDSKLFAAAGAWLGWTGLPLVALVASGTGLAFMLLRQVAGRGAGEPDRITFGPFLSLGFWMVWVLRNTDIYPG